MKTTFTYDSAANGVGKMATASNDGHTWRYSYDIMGRVTTQTLQAPIWNGQNQLTATAQYGFDYDGQLTNLYYPGVGYAPTGGSVAVGTQHQYTYDAVGRPTSLQYYSGSWITAAQNAHYNSAGQITSWQESADTLTRTYDAARGWITNISAANGGQGTLLNLTYNYQPDGRAASVTDGVTSGYSATYSYDELNRLTSATTANWSMSWTYDDFGNRTSQTLGGQTTTLQYANNNNRITTTGYSYDNNGNLTAMPGFANMQYDVFDRLTSATSTSSYKYDAFGRRIWRWTPDAAQRVYFYDPNGRLLSEFVVGGATTSYRYFAGQRVGQYTDRVGNVRYANGVARHYYPYGEEITSTNSDTYKFAQLHRDSDTGLDYAVNRYYVSSIGRFLSMDRAAPGPLIPQTWNRYAYVVGDPINGIDPLGLSTNLINLYIGDERTTGYNGYYAADCEHDATGVRVHTFPNGSGGFTIETQVATQDANGNWSGDPATATASVYVAEGGELRVESEVGSTGTQSYTTEDSAYSDGATSSYDPTDHPYKRFLSWDMNGTYQSSVSWGKWSHTNAPGGPAGDFGFSVAVSVNGTNVTVTQDYWATKGLGGMGIAPLDATVHIEHNFIDGVVRSFRDVRWDKTMGNRRPNDITYQRCRDLE